MEALAQKISDTTLGAGLAGGGTAGFLLQGLVEWTNYFVLFGNAALVLGGIYFMYLRWKRQVERNKQHTRRNDDAT